MSLIQRKPWKCKKQDKRTSAAPERLAGSAVTEGRADEKNTTHKDRSQSFTTMSWRLNTVLTQKFSGEALL